MHCLGEPGKRWDLCLYLLSQLRPHPGEVLLGGRGAASVSRAALGVRQEGWQGANVTGRPS